MKKKIRGAHALLLTAAAGLLLAGCGFAAHDLPDALAKVRHDGIRLATCGPSTLFKLIYSFQ